MRVLTLMPGLTPDAGAERSIVALAPLLAAAGVELHLAVLTERQGLVPELEAMGIPVHDLSASRGLVQRVRSLRALLRLIRPDLVHATLFEASQVAQVASLGSKVPVLITWANTDYTPESAVGVRFGKVKYEVYRRWEILLSRLTRPHYHAVTQGVAEHNGRRLKVAADRIKVGERGRDAAGLRAAAGSGTIVREELGLSETAKLIVAVGRQDHQKAHGALVATFDQYASSHPDARLAIAGRHGTGTGVLNAAIAASISPDSILVLGHRDDIPSLLAAADVVVCSSLKEGAAGALIEAMALGTPVVSVPLAGLSDVLIDGRNSRVTALADIPTVLDQLFGDPEQVDRLTAAARSDASARFSVDRAAGRLADIYSWASSAQERDAERTGVL